MPIYGHMFLFMGPMTLGAYIKVEGLHNNFFYIFFIGYGAVTFFVGVVNPFEVLHGLLVLN